MRSRTRRAGFTMLEMIIAVAVSIVVVTALYAMFVMQSRQFVIQDLRMEMNQNLRFGMDIMGRSLRMAGYGTGTELTGQFGWDGSSLSDDDTLPPIIASDAWNSSHDAVSVFYADPSVEMMTSVLTIETCTATSLAFDMNRKGYTRFISNIVDGDYLVCWDYTPVTGPEAYLWTVTSDGNSSTGKIGVSSNSTLYSDYDAVCGSNENLTPVMHCSKAQMLTFYIDDTDDGVGPGSPEHPMLMIDLNMDFLDSGPANDDIPLVDDIEDLQLAYCGSGGDTDGVDCSDSSNWEDEPTSSTDLENIWMVRYTMAARSRKEDTRGLDRSSPFAIENHAPSGGIDYYYRAMLTSQVSLRNVRAYFEGGTGGGS